MRMTYTAFFETLVISLLAFTGSPALAAIVERGPYLQQVTPRSITVRWRTDSETDAVVRYGLTTDALNLAAVGNQSGTEHEVTVSGLSPGTVYYYSVGDSAETLGGWRQFVQISYVADAWFYKQYARVGGRRFRHGRQRCPRRA